MSVYLRKKTIDLRAAFLVPTNSTHRQYEALRAYLVDELPSAEVAKRFGYHPGSFRVLVHEFRRDPDRAFFLPPPKGPRGAPKKDARREKVLLLRKQNFSIYDIHAALKKEGEPFSTAAIAALLKEEGFAKLPRRRDEERTASLRPQIAAVADVRELDLSSRSVRTQFGGLWLFAPFLAAIPLDDLLIQAGFPGSNMIPAGNAMRSLLGLKLFGSARHGHVMSAVMDDGLALFAGLNVVPKRSFLTEYSCRIHPESYPPFMQRWFDAVTALKLPRGSSFDLDFHTIHFHGEDALMEKHYISKRSRRQKGVLAFLAQDADAHVFCYANSDLRKADQNDEVLAFINFWKKRTGRLPTELIFDSKLTTYANLSTLNTKGIEFITLRRRSKKMLDQIRALPPSAWRRIELDAPSRIYRTPRIIDQRITLSDYDGEIRQIVINDLGHEEPTFLITNQISRSASKLITRYAQRMLIENNIADGIDFFHMDALSSAVALKVNCDIQLTLMASSLYRLFARKIGNGYELAKSRHIFRDFINASAAISISSSDIIVRFQKRAHNPFLLNAGFDATDVKIPWLGNRRLKLAFG